MKQAIGWLLIFAMLAGTFAGCAGAEEQLYSVTWLTFFDTVTTVTGRAESEDAFSHAAQEIYDELLICHQLFDIYNSYAGICNLKTINDAAGGEPIAVDSRILDLLSDCRGYYTLTGGRVNVMLGSVLALWHDAREAALEDPDSAALPDMQALEEAAQHTDIQSLVVDTEAGTVRITDAQARLDVGAVAKGWAAQRAAEIAPEGFLISVGGNVCATGAKDTAGTPWVIGITNPDGGDYLHTVNITGGSVVTSGDYERYFTVDGVRYHHIIDPSTLYPGTLWRSVTVLCADSALADALSTALFLLPREDGQAILDLCGAEAMWVDAAGNEYFSPGFESSLRQ